MSEQGGMDLSKVIGLIMENPKLIEEIAGLAKASSEPTPEPKSEETKPQISEAIQTQSQPTYRHTDKSSRAQLLGALKPFVSQERAKAIDSMITIADILDVMKTR